jgi:hypothetical protein
MKRWPGRGDAEANRSLAMLTLGDLAGGFEAYESRWRSAAFAGKSAGPTSRAGTAKIARGKSILITTEQGMGDVIQFIRYAPLIADRGRERARGDRAELRPVIATVAGDRSDLRRRREDAAAGFLCAHRELAAHLSHDAGDDPGGRCRTSAADPERGGAVAERERCGMRAMR